MAKAKAKNTTKPNVAKRIRPKLGSRQNLCFVDENKLRDMSMYELANFRDAVHTTTQVLSGLLCQPRFHGDNDGGLNHAGDALETLLRFMDENENSAVEALQRAKPTDALGAKYRAWGILGYWADMFDCLSEFSVKVSQLVHDVQVLEFHENRR